MSSCGNEVSRWNLRHIRRIAEVLKPDTSPSYANKLSSETPGIDQCLNISGKADSAYSSFSGGYNIPECHIPSCDSDCDILPLEQLPYMDSGYVRGVFNPCALHSHLEQIYQGKSGDMSVHNNMDNDMPCGSTSVSGTSHQPPSPVARRPPHLPHPSSPAAQDNTYKASRNIVQSHYGICFDYSIQADECCQDTSKTLPFDSSEKSYDDGCLSQYINKSPVVELEDSDAWYLPGQYMTEKNETIISTNPYLHVQDCLKFGSVVHAHNSAHNYKIPEALNSKPSLSLHTSHNAVNDTQENKQYLYACRVHKPPFTEADLPCTMSLSGEQEGQLCGVFKADKHSGLEVPKSSPGLKYTDSSLPSLTALGLIDTSGNKNHRFSSRKENSKHSGQPLLEQQARRQKLPSAFQILSGVRKAKQSEDDGSPDLLTKPKREEMPTSVRSPQQFSKKAESQSWDDFANRKINRRTTPLLYYLSGGENTNIMSNSNQAPSHEDFDMQSPRSDCSVSAEPMEIPRDSNSCVNDIAAGQKTGLILGSPASSVDEKNDYREKLKVAQRKVLRETSFKRKDLQMSLPIRLKQKPSSKPSIQHLRSLSLSSTNEDSGLISSSKPLENINKQEEPPRPQASLIGGRKRITKEQKTISFSEPEKLNQLDDQRDHNTAWRKPNARSRSDEINEQDPVVFNNKGLGNQGRALSKVELKQIQHNALLQYMERKTGQRPATAHTRAPQKPPFQTRPSNSKFSEDGISYRSSSKKSQSIDSSCPFSDLRKNLEAPVLLSSATSVSPASVRGWVSSSVSEKVNWEMQPAVSEGTCVSRCTSTKSPLDLGSSVSGKGHRRSKSTPSPMQVIKNLLRYNLPSCARCSC